MPAPDSGWRWPRRLLITLGLLGVFTPLLPWIHTEVTFQDGRPPLTGYHNGIPGEDIEAAIIGWRALIAAALFLALALGLLVTPPVRPRLSAACGLVIGLVAILVAVSAFASGSPLGPFRGEKWRMDGVPAHIEFTKSVGPYVVFSLGLAMAAIGAWLYRLTGEPGCPPRSSRHQATETCEEN